AKILLLDVQRDAAAKKDEEKDRVINWPTRSYVAVMRYAELGQAAQADEGHLIRAWQKALTRASKLQEVEHYVHVLAHVLDALLRKNQKSLLYNVYMPRGLWDLVIGGKT